VLLAWLALGAAANAEEQTAWGYELADELMSPWCPGFALPDCSSGYASDLRLWILDQEKRGRSREDVKAEILARYGDMMLQAPKAEGLGVLAYAIPAGLVLAGGAVLFVFLRKQGGAASGARDLQAGAADPQIAARIDAEFAAYDNAKPVE
jgi:cytochrome c-type biogenesis protein CcmH